MATKEKKTKSDSGDVTWPFGMKNYILFGIAMAVIIVGFIMLGQGSISMAPILLILGYCVLIPVALIFRDKSVDDDSEAEAAAE